MRAVAGASDEASYEGTMAGDACGRCHCGLRWSSLRGHEALYWVGLTHAGGAAVAFGGAPYGATNR
eukprot:8099088-Pyramimonas_sp.AAC.1